MIQHKCDLPQTCSAAGNTARRILLVEETVETRHIINLRLQREGFTVIATCSREEAVEMVTLQGLPHLAIVNLRPPDMEGFAVADTLHRIGNIPIVFISAMTDLNTKVEALTRYAEDFITKPFVYAEFLARIRRVLLRNWTDGEIHKDVTIDQRLRINFYHPYALLDDKHILLTPTESRLLQELYMHRGRVLSVDALLKQVWNADQQGTLSALRVHIQRLRAKVEPDTRRCRYILTVRGRGYYLPTLARREMCLDA